MNWFHPHLLEMSQAHILQLEPTHIYHNKLITQQVPVTPT